MSRTAPVDRAMLAGILLLLVALNLLGNLVVEGVAYVVTNLVGAVAAVLAARARGVTLEQLGLARGHLRRGALVGLAAAATVAGAVVVLTAVPVARDTFVAAGSGTGSADVVWQVLVRIPLGTALPEELLFRSVLLGVLLTSLAPRWAVAWSSLAFGLWHVLPTLTAGPVSGGAAVVAGNVAATAVAGLLFAWLRLSSGSVVAPVLAHVAVNGVALVAAVVVAGSV